MNATHLHECLHALNWSQRHLAALTDVDERQVRRWAAGARIPERIAAWLELAMEELAPLVRAAEEWMAEHPAPRKEVK